MARLNTTELSIKVSTMVRDDQESKVLLSPESITQLEEIIGELAADDVLVEIFSSDD